MKKTDDKRPRSQIKKLSSQVKVEEFAHYRDFLKAVYEVLKGNFKPYSYYHFSEDIGLGYCPASRLIINGSRPLTVNAGKKICESIGLVLSQRAYFLKLVEVGRKASPSETMDHLVEKKQVLASELGKEQLEFFRHWYNSALLEYLRFYDGPPAAAIGRKMIPKVSVGKIVKSLDLLQKLNYIKFDTGKNKFEVIVEQVHTEKDVVGVSYQAYHDQYISLARESITKLKTEDRTIASASITTSPKLKKEIVRRFYKAIEEVMKEADECEGTDEVTQVNIQIFPVAKK